jgi:uridylate kinase
VIDEPAASDVAASRPYRRALLKLSGEVFGGGRIGLDIDVLNSIAHQVREVVNSGVQMALVVGGGNFFAARSSPSWGSTGRGPTTWACSVR